ncbi:MAG TPA: phosphate ABC transporter permease PstA [Sphingomicrobium sp.]|jgi:phosphate transport system permease protein
MNSATAEAAITRWTGDAMQSRLRRRYRSERNFRLLGFGAVAVSLAFLAFLLGTMLWQGAGGLTLDFLKASDSTDPAMAGVWGALKGSFLTIIVTMALAFPVGVLSAIYLEEFATRNRWTDIIEVSINNLAAVPSIIFGLLGLAVFLNFMHLPRSAPLVGGLTLALMTMPVIVIAGRNAITSVPPSIREAALGVGASKMQVVFHHVLPLALPGILTGTIIGLARALGETAPLLMIGMRAFIAVPPSGITEPATVLPVQIFLWSDEVDRAFVEKTSAAIIVLLVFMLLMNGLAIYLRNRFEQRW